MFSTPKQRGVLTIYYGRYRCYGWTAWVPLMIAPVRSGLSDRAPISGVCVSIFGLAFYASL